MAWDNEKTNVRFNHYVHGQSDDNFQWYELCQEAEVDPEEGGAINKFHYAFYENTLDCEVDLDTGEVRCWGINGTPLKDPVQV